MLTVYKLCSVRYWPSQQLLKWDWVSSSSFYRQGNWDPERLNWDWEVPQVTQDLNLDADPASRKQLTAPALGSNAQRVLGPGKVQTYKMLGWPCPKWAKSRGEAMGGREKTDNQTNFSKQGRWEMEEVKYTLLKQKAELLSLHLGAGESLY